MWRKKEKTLLTNQELILEATYLVANGNLPLALHTLDQMHFFDSVTLAESFRLKGLIAFIQGNYPQSLEFFQHPLLQTDAAFSSLCTTKILDQLASSQKLELIADDIERCELLNNSSLQTDYLWPNTLLKMKSGESFDPYKSAVFSSIKNRFQVKDRLLISWLKLGLYFAPVEEMLSVIPSFDEEVLASSDVRELVALLYFKQGNIPMAKKFIQGITSANAYNLQGIFAIREENWRMAYEQFSHALEKRSSSVNALEHLLPLVPRMRTFEDGIILANQIKKTPANQKKRLTLLAYFSFKNKNYVKAEDYIEELWQLNGEKFSLELNLLAENIYLALQKKKKSLFYARAACAQFDIFSCWMSGELIIWPNFAKTIAREDETIHKNAFNFESLMKGEIKPLPENVLVDQRDIEELDNQLVQLK